MRLTTWIAYEARRRGLTPYQIEYKIKYTSEYEGLIIKRIGRFKYVVGQEYKAI